MTKWKPVSLVGGGDFEGLVAIEELNCYNDSKVITGGSVIKVLIHMLFKITLLMHYFINLCWILEKKETKKY